MQIFDFSSPRFWPQLERFCAGADVSASVKQTVASVIADVAKNGDAAVLKYTEKFDGVKLPKGALRVSEEKINASLKALGKKDRAQIKEAMRMVAHFHKKTLPKSWRAKNPHGGVVGEQFYPIRRVGINVPAGQVPLVSSVVMTVLLAKIAGVPRIAVCTPPQKNGSPDPGLLAALHLCGVTEVYAMGGIQAMAALALGTKTVAPVDKLFGPGNLWVTQAKRQLFGKVGVDLLPGPSEVMVIADSKSNPAWTAADLLSQAEHGTGREKIYLVVQGTTLLKKIQKELLKQQALIAGNKGAQQVLKEGCFVALVKDIKDAAQIANYVAPEHLEVHVGDAKLLKWFSQAITTAGAMLLGETTPTALGDFTAGPSHTLPTGRTGRFFSGLRVDDFMRRTSIVSYDEKSLRRAQGVIDTFARMEQLPAHGRSLSIRLKK